MFEDGRTKSTVPFLNSGRCNWSRRIWFPSRLLKYSGEAAYNTEHVSPRANRESTHFQSRGRTSYTSNASHLSSTYTKCSHMPCIFRIERAHHQSDCNLRVEFPLLRVVFRRMAGLWLPGELGMILQALTMMECAKLSTLQNEGLNCLYISL